MGGLEWFSEGASDGPSAGVARDGVGGGGTWAAARVGGPCDGRDADGDGLGWGDSGVSVWGFGADCGGPDFCLQRNSVWDGYAQDAVQAPKRVEGDWDNVLVCTEWAARAPQQNPDRGKPNPVNQGFAALEGGPFRYGLPPEEGAQSEDCLHVNVWTPGMRDRKRRPVLFYVDGAAYNNGSVNSALYDGTRMAERGDVVVVTVNHRLNAFGYLYLGAVAGLGPEYAVSGNAGMLDLVLALVWVKENIEQFGGDPGRVTIFGQGGGGAKCATLMAMPAAQGLFHRVWTMSGQQVWAVPQKKATTNANAALAAMGVEGEVTPDKLRALTVEQIQAGARTTGNWLPVKDGEVLKRDPFDPDAPAMSDEVPMVLGGMKDEGVGAAAERQAGLTWETLPEELGRQLGAARGMYAVGEIVAAYRGWYPAYRPVDVYVAAVAAFRAWPGQVIEAERRATNVLAAERTWMYEMEFGSPVAEGRAPQGLDVAFVFDNLRLAPGMVGATEAAVVAAQPLATAMSEALVRFARDGDPNGARVGKTGLPKWPVYGVKDRETMVFGKVSRGVEDPRGKERRMMVGARYRQPGT